MSTQTRIKQIEKTHTPKAEVNPYMTMPLKDFLQALKRWLESGASIPDETRNKIKAVLHDNEVTNTEN
jgi:hypothetical protein